MTARTRQPAAATASRALICPKGCGPEAAWVGDAHVIAARDLGGDPVALGEAYPRIEAIAFDPDIKMMASVNRAGDDAIAHVKGAPEAVLAVAGQAAPETKK